MSSDYKYLFGGLLLGQRLNCFCTEFMQSLQRERSAPLSTIILVHWCVYNAKTVVSGGVLMSLC